MKTPPQAGYSRMRENETGTTSRPIFGMARLLSTLIRARLDHAVEGPIRPTSNSVRLQRHGRRRGHHTHRCCPSSRPFMSGKIIKTRGSFPHHEAALKLLTLRSKSGLRWRRGIEWTTAMGQFAIQFGDRFSGSARWPRKTNITAHRSALHKISDTPRSGVAVHHRSSAPCAVACHLARPGLCRAHPL